MFFKVPSRFRLNSLHFTTRVLLIRSEFSLTHIKIGLNLFYLFRNVCEQGFRCFPLVIFQNERSLSNLVFLLSQFSLHFRNLLHGIGNKTLAQTIFIRSDQAIQKQMLTINLINLPLLPLLTRLHQLLLVNSEILHSIIYQHFNYIKLFRSTQLILNLGKLDTLQIDLPLDPRLSEINILIIINS